MSGVVAPCPSHGVGDKSNDNYYNGTCDLDHVDILANPDFSADVAHTHSERIIKNARNLSPPPNFR